MIRWNPRDGFNSAVNSILNRELGAPTNWYDNTLLCISPTSCICRVGSAVGFDFCTLETASIDDSQVTDNIKEYLADLITIYGYDHTSQDWPLSIPSFSVPTATKTSSSQVSKLSSQESNLTFVRFFGVFPKITQSQMTNTTSLQVPKLTSKAPNCKQCAWSFTPLSESLNSSSGSCSTTVSDTTQCQQIRQIITFLYLPRLRGAIRYVVFVILQHA